MHEAATSQGVKQTCSRDEVAVEDLEQGEQRARENQPCDPRRAEGARERRLGAEVLAHDTGPGIDPRDHRDHEHVEQPARADRHDDHAAQRAGGKIWSRFFRSLRDRLESGHEIRDDLQDEQHGDECP